jgi:hypothetical protein
MSGDPNANGRGAPPGGEPGPRDASASRPARLGRAAAPRPRRDRLDKPGVLNRVASLMRARNFNIDSLAVSRTDQRRSAA